MKKVYLIIGSSGYWEGKYEWIEDAYFDKSRAEKVKDSLNEQLSKSLEWLYSEEYGEIRYETDYCDVTNCKHCKHHKYCRFEYDQHEFETKEVDVNE